jgi:ABC-type transport system substrate-binding protein
MPMSLQTGGVGLYNALNYVKTWYLSSSAGGLIGPGNFTNGDVDRLWQAGVNSPDPKVQRASAKQIQDILVKALPVAPISRLPLDAAVRANVKGINISGPGLMFLAHAAKK